MQFDKTKNSEENNSRWPHSSKKPFLTPSSSLSKPKSPVCSEQHYLNQCESFKTMNMSTHRKYEFMKQNRLCIVLLLIRLI